MPHIPGCGLLRAGSFAKSLSLLRAVGSSHLELQRGQRQSLREPQHHIVEIPMPIAPPRISQPSVPTCHSTSLGYLLVSRHLWGCRVSCHLVSMGGEMEQVEQKSVSMGKLQMDRLVACSLLK